MNSLTFLQQYLDDYRAAIGFDPARYVQAKVRLINSYLSSPTPIETVIVGVSGGIDSAVVLRLLMAAKEERDSPIRRVVGMLLPFGASVGATDQAQATSLGRTVATALGAEILEIDLSESLKTMRSTLDSPLQLKATPWLEGQLLSLLRAPAFYYAANAEMQRRSIPGVVAGTINRSELVIGYWGKYSDGAADIFPITDLYKWMVYDLARWFGDIPEAILEATPKGDVHDGKSDEERVGAPYEMWELCHELSADSDKGEALLHAFIAGAPQELRAELTRWMRNVQAHRDANFHKFMSGPHGVHFPVMPSGGPGGWREFLPPLPPPRHPGPGVLTAEFSMPNSVLALLKQSTGTTPRRCRVSIADYGDSAFLLKEVFSEAECEALRSLYAGQQTDNVGIFGYRLSDQEQGSEPGSTRCTAFSPEFAEILWKRIQGSIPSLRILEPSDVPDTEDTPVWRPIGVSPRTLFIEYQPGGSLRPHHDKAFVYQSEAYPPGCVAHRTLMSIVVCLDDDHEGGETGFVRDPLRALPAAERSFEDWDRDADDHEYVARVRHNAGDVLIFDHHLLHDGCRVLSGRKLIVRTDIIFEPRGQQRYRKPTPQNRAEDSILTLGLRLPATREQVAAAYSQALSHSGHNDGQGPQLQLIAKVLLDPQYQSAWPQLGWADMVKAGFYDDGADPTDLNLDRWDPLWMRTPLHKVMRQLRKLEALEAAGEQQPKELVVLLLTGALAPVRKGHVEALERAKRAIESRGTVACIGGFLSPDGDNYVLRKVGPTTPPATVRVHLAEMEVRESEWIAVDGWNALDNGDVAVNFTSVRERLEWYLNTHIVCGRPIRVLPVVGSDNASFALAFTRRAGLVVCERPDAREKFAQISNHPVVRTNRRVTLVPAAQDTDTGSSTLVRAGNLSYLSEHVAEEWVRRGEGAVVAIEPLPPGGIVNVRFEEEWAIAHWVTDERSQTVLAAAYQEFSLGIVNTLEHLFDRFGWSVHVASVTLADQRAQVEQMRDRVVSLDPCIEGQHQLAISRCFPIAESFGKAEMVPRPGSPSIEKQLAAIPQGSVVLVDDDCVTNGTLTWAKQLLAGKVKVLRAQPLQVTLVGENGEVQEVLDCRDALPGSREGGLVVLDPRGAHVRVPYVLPYVHPSARISIPLLGQRAFSLMVWELAETFFRAVTPAIKLHEADPAARSFWRYLGFKDDSTMADLCAWHRHRLR